MNDTVLVIGDLHAPFMHPDAVKFLKAVKRKFKPDRVIQVGDEIDGHSISFHEHSPDLYSPRTELDMARIALRPLYDLFPDVSLLSSNHGSLVYRKAAAAGLPSEVIKGYREILEAPHGWRWHDDLTIKTALGPVYFTHGKSGAYEKLSKNMAMNAVQGHFHQKFYITYWGSPVGLFWDMNVGCLVDNSAMAFAYGKNNLPRPIVGCAIIQNGVPQLVPMILKKGGKWVGTL